MSALLSNPSMSTFEFDVNVRPIGLNSATVQSQPCFHLSWARFVRMAEISCDASMLMVRVVSELVGVRRQSVAVGWTVVSTDHAGISALIHLRKPTYNL